MSKLSETATRIVTYTTDYKRAHNGLLPTVRTVAAGVGVGTTAVHYHRKRLIAQGVLTVDGDIPGGRWLGPVEAALWTNEQYERVLSRIAIRHLMAVTHE